MFDFVLEESKVLTGQGELRELQTPGLMELTDTVGISPLQGRAKVRLGTTDSALKQSVIRESIKKVRGCIMSQWEVFGLAALRFPLAVDLHPERRQLPFVQAHSTLTHILTDTARSLSGVLYQIVLCRCTQKDYYLFLRLC